MWKTVRILLLVLLLLTNVKTTELSDQKKCGDPECETTISRVQTIKDYTGPDCRYLNFKSGEEIMVYFKLSRKREDLWAGSKGKDFGYFPMDAVQTEEVFITEEVEVPTKETDFLCLDGGEYVFENKDSIFNTENEEYEHVPFHADEDYSKSNMPRDEAMEVTGTSFPKEYKEPDSDDGKSEDQHTPEIIWVGDSELRGSKTGVDENIREEDHRSHSLQPDPKQATWSASGIASWLGLGGKQEEEPVREISKTSETITFRRRKIAIIDDSDFKKLNDDSETEPRTWFQSALTDFMHFGNKKAGFSLLHKENDPDVQDISRITGDADHYGSTTASDTQEKKSRDSTVSKSNWFDLDISDVLTFGYLNENKVQREKYGETETASPNEETGILMDQSLEEQISESPPHHEVQEKYIQEITEVKKPDSKVQLTNDHTEFKEAMDTSVSTEPGDKLLKSHYAEHSSVSDSEITENFNIKAIMKESGRKNDQSGWYESIYSNIFGFSRVKSDNWPAHNSVSIQRSQELAIPSHGEDQNFLQKDSSTAREENSGSPQTHQSFFSSSPFTNTLNAEGFASKEKGNVQITEQALLSREGSSQSKKENKIFHIKKESKVQLVGNQKVTEKVSVILDVATFQEATKKHKENREKTQDVELEKDISTLKFVKFRSEQGICYDHDIQITTYGKPENSEIQNYSSIEDKNYCPILEDKQWSFLDDSLTQWKSTRENINAHEKFAPVIKEPDDGVAVRLKYSEIDFSHLSAAQIYLQRLPKGEMTETTTDKEGSNQATDRKLTFEELKELPEHFPQTKDNLHEDGVLHDVSDDDKLDIQQSREQMLSANLEVIENIEVKEIARHSDGIKSQKKINHPPPNDITNVNANLFHNQNEEGEVISQDIQNSAQFPSFSRASEDKKHVNYKLQEGYVVDSYDENESPDLKSKGKLNHTKDYFPTNSDYNVNLTRSEIPHESINQPCQERIKERGQPSQHVSELSESKHGDSIQDTEDELKKQTNKNNPDVLNNQEPSPVATSKEVFKGEKDIPGNGACMSKDDFISYRVHNKDIQIPHKWAAGKSGEAEHSSKSIQENVVNAVSDASSTTKAVDDHGLKAQVILSYPSSGTFSSQTPVSLPYLKEDKKNLKAEQEVLSSHPEPSDCEKEIVVKNIEGSNGNTGKEGMGNIFTTWFLGRLFQNHNEESQINDKRADNIVTQGLEVKIMGSDSEQNKGEVQSTKAISYSTDNFKIMEQGTQDEIHKHTQEKSAPLDSKIDSPKYNIFLIQKTVSIAQETVKNYKLISDKKLKVEKVEYYINLAQEFKRILQATMCESYELLLLEQEIENLCHDITAFPCEEVVSERKQEIAPVEYENTFMTEQKKCLNKKTYLVANLQSLMLDVRNKCEAQQTDSGTTNTGKLSCGAATVHLDKKPNSGQHLKTNKIPSVNTEYKMCTSKSSGQLNLKERGLVQNPVPQNCTFRYEREWPFQIILYLNDICDLVKSAFSCVMFMREKVVAALPDNVRPGPNLYGFPWEMVICCTVVALLIAFLLMYRSYQSVRSRLYVGREKQLANKVAELVEDKCKVLEQLSLCKKEYEELENSLKDTTLLSASTSASNCKTACEQLSSSNSVLKKEIECLEKELEEEKSKRSQQDDLVAEIQRRMESLESEAKSTYQQIAEAKTTLKVYDINRERLKMSVQNAVEENRHLQESEKQLLQEAVGWNERFSELIEQTKMFESSKADIDESLKNKESQVKSLTECLLKMKDWISAIEEQDDTEDSYWANDTKEKTENGEHLDDQDKRTVRKLIYAAKLNASLKSLETERNQIYSKLTDENKAKEELAERIENLQREHVTLQSENKHFESEVQKLQQKLKVVTELYQENEMNLHRKLTVEEKERLQKEEKLSKVDKKINHATEELATYRQRAKDLEDELERTVRSYQNQIMSHEKKAHDNWLTARATERLLNDIKKENLHCRQELTEAEIKCDILEKDPYALHVPVRAFGREQSPYGPSPMGRPSSETRAFLSPPTLLEGPLRLSPVLPGGGGRGSRGPGNAGIYEASNEREEMSSDRLSNPHRPPSDSGSLSPPWDRDRRIMMPFPAGKPYNDQPLPPQRQERFYPNPPNSGRLSGPAELRSYNMHSFDKADGHISESNSRMDLSGNGIKDIPNDSNMSHVADHPVASEGETFGPGVVPPPPFPLLRAPLMPMDPRGPFMRRGPPFPPVPPSGVYGPREYFPRDFAGLPRPPLPMRTPFPLRPFSQYPPPRAGFFPPPPPPPPPDNSNELPSGSTQLSAAASTDHQEPQQET